MSKYMSNRRIFITPTAHPEEPFDCAQGKLRDEGFQDE